MNLRRTFATAGRVLSQIRHDPRTIGLLLIVPSLLIGLVAWIFTDTDVFATIGPAMIALFPFIVMFLVTSIATLRERRSGTLERLFSMPMGKGDFILGYALAFGLLAVFQTAIAVSFAVWVCGLEIEGSIWLLFAVAVADALLGMSLGLLASAFARTEFQVVQFLPVFAFPQILLCGIFIPRDQLPEGLEVDQRLAAAELRGRCAAGRRRRLRGHRLDRREDPRARRVDRRLHRRRIGHPAASHALVLQDPSKRRRPTDYAPACSENAPGRCCSPPPPSTRSRYGFANRRSGSSSSRTRRKSSKRGYTSRSVSAVCVCSLPQCGRPP